MDKTERPLTAKQESFVQYFADSGSDTFNNATQSMIKAGYDARYADNHCNRVVGHGGVKEAIKAYKAKTTAGLDHTRQIAIDHLNSVIDQCNIILEAQPHNVAALTAKTGAIRELNAISNLHSSTLITDDKQEQQLSQAQAKAAKRLAPFLLLNGAG